MGRGALGAKKKGTRKRLQSKAGQHHSLSQVPVVNGLGEARCFAADCTLAASSCAKGREWERTPVGSENLQSSREGLSWVSPERPALLRMLGNGTKALLLWLLAHPTFWLAKVVKVSIIGAQSFRKRYGVEAGESNNNKPESINGNPGFCALKQMK